MIRILQGYRSGKGERELLANKLLNEEKKHLHDKALPMITARRMSIDGLTEDQVTI